MKRYPLHKLLQLREHRAEKARRVVLERQRDVQQCRDECSRMEETIASLQSERQSQRLRLLDAPPPGVGWPMAMAQREAHIEWLAAEVETAQQQLAQARERLRHAEQALDEARNLFLRAKARHEALEKRQDVWRGEQRAIDVRNEELVTADLLMARQVAANQTH